MNSTNIPIIAGARVRLAEGYRFFDAGDTGRAEIVDTDTGMAWVAFDEGATDAIPLALLVEDRQEFRYRTPDGVMSPAFTSEESACDAAEDSGLLEWELVEIRHAASCTRVLVTAPPGITLH